MNYGPNYWPCIWVDLHRWCVSSLGCELVNWPAIPKEPLRPLPLVEDPFEHIGMESRLGRIAPRPKLGNGGLWRDVWCQGRFSIAWPRLPYFSRMPRPGEGVLHRKKWLKSLMSRKQIVNKVIHVSITLCALGPFYHTYYEQSPEKFW